MRRVVGWGTFAAFLVAVGATTHVALVPVPTWGVPFNKGLLLGDAPKLIADELVVLRLSGNDTSGGVLLGFDAATGRLRYATPDDDPGTTDIHFGERLAVTVANKVEATIVRLFELHTGRERWKARFKPESGVLHFLSGDGVVLVSEGIGETRRVVALETETGKSIGQWDLVNESFRGRVVQVSSGEKGWALWDSRTRRTLPPPGGGDECGLIADGVALVTRAGERSLWNITDPERPERLMDGLPIGGVVLLSRDARRALVVRDGEGQESLLYSLAVGRPEERWTYRLKPSAEDFALSPDGRCCLIGYPPPPGSNRRGRTGVLLDLEARRDVLTVPDLLSWHFTPDSRSLMVEDEQGWALLDTATGATRFAHATELLMYTLVRPRFTGRHVFYETPPDPPPADGGWAGSSLLCRDLDTLAVLARIPSADMHDYAIASDASFLIAVEDGWALERWDLPPRRRWPWIVGAPLLLAVALLALRAAWSRYRAPTADPNRSREPAT